MTTVRLGLVVGLLVALLPSAMSLAEDVAPRLLAMLAQVPQAEISDQGGWATVSYVDYAALASAEGIAPLRALGDVGLLMTTVPLGGMLSRIIAGPEALSYLYLSVGKMADAVGLEWLLHVDRSLEFGDPPNPGLLVDGSFDAEAISSTLQGRGFARADVDGVPVWHRFDDLSISLAARDVADPFGGHLGAAARIALLPDMLANARSWSLIEAIVAASQGAQPSLADDTGYRVLGEAITAPDGWLIQALFFTGASLRLVGDAAQGGPGPEDDGFGGLPPFSLAVLADRQEGNDQVHLIGLVCVDTATAHAAVEALARRLQEFRLPDRPDEALADQFGAAFSASVVEGSQEGLAVALVEARYPLPTPRTDPETGHFSTGGLLYRAWVQAIMRGEFTPLW